MSSNLLSLPPPPTPDHIMLTADGRMKLIDFSLALNIGAEGSDAARTATSKVIIRVHPCPISNSFLPHVHSIPAPYPLHPCPSSTRYLTRRGPVATAYYLLLTAYYLPLTTLPLTSYYLLPRRGPGATGHLRLSTESRTVSNLIGGASV